jgi:hypothetical protein
VQYFTAKTEYILWVNWSIALGHHCGGGLLRGNEICDVITVTLLWPHFLFFFSHRRPFRIFQLAFLLPLHFSFWTVDCAGGRIFSVSQNSALLRLSNWATKIVESPWAPDCPARTCVEGPSVFIGLIKCLKYKRRIKVYSRSLLEMSKQIWSVIYWEITWVGLMENAHEMPNWTLILLDKTNSLRERRGYVILMVAPGAPFRCKK